MLPRFVAVMVLVLTLAIAACGERDGSTGVEPAVSPITELPTPTGTTAPESTPTVATKAASTEYELVDTWGEGRAVPEFPISVVLDDDGTLVVADAGQGEVLFFSPEGELLSSWSPPEMRALPNGVDLNEAINQPIRKFDRDGLADGRNNRIVRFDAEAGLSTFVVGDEPGTFGTPAGITVGSDGSVYVVDPQLSHIQVFDADGNVVAVHDYNILNPPVYIPHATGIAVNQVGEIFIAGNMGPGRILKLSPDGELLEEWGYPLQSDPGERPRIFAPRDIALADDGSMYVTMGQDPWIARINSAGEMDATRYFEYGQVRSVEVHDGDVYVLILEPLGADEGAQIRITRLDASLDGEGEDVIVFPLTEESEGHLLSDFTIDSDGDIVAVDWQNRQILSVDPEGEVTAEWPIGVGDPETRADLYVTTGVDGRIYGADWHTDQILVYAPAS